MARIAGVNIPDNKKVLIALTYIVGVGQTTSKKILTDAKIDEHTRVKDLNEKQLDQIRTSLALLPTEVEVRREQALNVKRLQDIGSYKGYRHRMGLPCRGQGTASNARTCKARAGKKRVAIAAKKG